MKTKPSEVSPFVLTPPTLRKKVGVVGFDKEGNYYKARNDEAQAYNPFDEYVFQNLGVLECFINKCAAHSHSCAGELQFIGENNSVSLRPFMGLYFLCTKCSAGCVVLSC